MLNRRQSEFVSPYANMQSVGNLGEYSTKAIDLRSIQGNRIGCIDSGDRFLRQVLLQFSESLLRDELGPGDSMKEDAGDHLP